MMSTSWRHKNEIVYNICICTIGGRAYKQNNTWFHGRLICEYGPIWWKKKCRKHTGNFFYATYFYRYAGVEWVQVQRCVYNYANFFYKQICSEEVASFPCRDNCCDYLNFGYLMCDFRILSIVGRCVFWLCVVFLCKLRSNFIFKDRTALLRFDTHMYTNGPNLSRTLFKIYQIQY